MEIFSKQTHDPRSNALPLEVYDSVVRSLHGDRKALFVGKLATWISVFLVCYRTENLLLNFCALLLVLVGGLRVIAILRFQRKAEGKLDLAALKAGEKSYRFWASAYVALLGMFCFFSLAVTSDDTIHLMVIATTLAYVIGIAGRNFASAKVVNAQVIAVSIPLVSGLVFFGEAYHTFLACLLLPFLLAKHSIADRLRRMLFNAVFTAMDNKTIADRFEVALKNASHGMAMIDRDGTFLVVNERFNELFGVPRDHKTVGSTLSSLANHEMRERNAVVPRESLTDMVRLCLVEGKRKRFNHRRADGKTIEISFNPMAEGAGVIVLENISERIKSEAEIRQLANFDSLTHLPNRRYFTEIVKNRIREEGKEDRYSLYFADLDNFKDINDSLGHPVGDKLICAVSLRMKSCMPEDGLICRFGGDEFVIMLPAVTDRKDCREFAEKMIEEVSKPILIDGHLIIVGTSVGIALCPENGTDFDQLLKMADVSLYEAKDRGRGTAYFYSDELGAQIRDRRQLEVDLRRAVQRNELTVHYQPLIDVKQDRVAACEALARWHHPERGMIPPSTFIPIAEDMGIISKIGEFVLEEATRQCKSWPGEVKVAVNVSSLQFQQSDVCAVIEEALSASGLPANRLEVEVTESAAVNDLEETSRVLRTLAQGGVGISLDDFGTGFSSLSYLHLLPLNKVKIDRSFLETIRDDERSLILLSGVTRMAAALGLTVIVEGIEEEEQLNILKKNIHLDQVQGYLFGKAMPPAEIRRFLTEYNASAHRLAGASKAS